MQNSSCFSKLITAGCWIFFQKIFRNFFSPHEDLRSKSFAEVNTKGADSYMRYRWNFLGIGRFSTISWHFRVFNFCVHRRNLLLSCSPQQNIDCADLRGVKKISKVCRIFWKKSSILAWITLEKKLESCTLQKLVHINFFNMSIFLSLISKFCLFLQYSLWLHCSTNIQSLKVFYLWESRNLLGLMNESLFKDKGCETKPLILNWDEPANFDVG